MCNVEGPPLKKRKPQPLHPMESIPIYLDYNATTPLCDEAWAEMCSNRHAWGNPSSTHPFGLAAKYALEMAREKTAKAINAPDPSESIIFTSGGTESNNLAIIGGSRAVNERDPNRVYVLSSTTEHPAVAEVLNHLSSGRMKQLLVSVDPSTGCVSAEHLSKVLKSIPGGPRAVAVVSIMHANNETGSINPIAELVPIVKQLCGPEALFHCDAAQSIGKILVDVKAMGVDLLSVCSHKFYGPKGVGALYIKKNTPVKNVTYGAGHERGIRPGTENVLLSSGMAEALRIACSNLEANSAVMRTMRDTLLSVLEEELKKVKMWYVVNGSIESALPNTLNIALFRDTESGGLAQPPPQDSKSQSPSTKRVYISAQRLIHEVGDRVAMSAGSACHSTAGDEPLVVSKPLQGVGVDIERAIGTLRLSTGRTTKVAEVRTAARTIARAAAHQFAE